MNRTVPAESEILVPETLLKKRKSQEKEREDRAAELQKKKKVGRLAHPFPRIPSTKRQMRTDPWDEKWTMVMKNTTTPRLDLTKVDAVAIPNIIFRV